MSNRRYQSFDAVDYEELTIDKATIKTTTPHSDQPTTVGLPDVVNRLSIEQIGQNIAAIRTHTLELIHDANPARGSR